MIVTFTDFGLEGPYTGQMTARLLNDAPGARIISLFADAPAFDPRASAYLLSAYAEEFPAGTVFLCVVDPGVGGDRPPVIVEADGRWFVGPGNGLFELVRRRAATSRIWEIDWRPEDLSASFHGRDLFAPVAAALESGEPPRGNEREPDWNRFSDWPDQLSEIVYIDCYGNAMTGLSAHYVNPQFALLVNNVYVSHGRTFSDVPQGGPFWYVNANGLVEFAVNGGRAADALNLEIGCAFEIARDK